MKSRWLPARKLLTGVNLLILMYVTHHFSFLRQSVLSLSEDLKSSVTTRNADGNGNGVSEAKIFVQSLQFSYNLDEVFTSGINKEMTARWSYITNITDENEKKQVCQSN